MIQQLINIFNEKNKIFFVKININNTLFIIIFYFIFILKNISILKNMNILKIIAFFAFFVLLNAQINRKIHTKLVVNWANSNILPILEAGYILFI